MKKNVCMMLALILALTALPVLAEQAGAFTFPNGMQWGMSVGHYAEMTTNSYITAIPENHVVIVSYDDGDFDKFKPIHMDWIFVNDGLAACSAHIASGNPAEDAAYLLETMSAVYGETAQGDWDAFLQIMEGLGAQMDQLNPSGEGTVHYWQLAEDTGLWLIQEGAPGSIDIIYYCMH